MSLALYRDEHIRGGITRGLRRRGISVLTAQEDGASGIPDPALLDRATALGHVLFSGDRDLLREAARRQQQGVPFAGMVFAHPRNVSVRRCIDDLEVLAVVLDPAAVQDCVIYLPLP